jgi:NADH-quinone oxidoreductase subunit J
MVMVHNLICSILLLSGFLVAFSTNPIQSVLFLIATFCSAGAALMLFHSEFFGLIFIIIYVGAIAVLFLFVIMMLNVKNDNETTYLFGNKNLEFGILAIGFYSFFILLKLNFQKFFHKENGSFAFQEDFSLDLFNNIDVLGQVMYNYYFVCFLFAGLLLLIALLGAVVLTLKFNEIKKSQLANRQLARSDKFLSFFN